MTERAVPGSVWATAQASARAQRAGRYLPASTKHPARMLPVLAARAIAEFSEPGDVVLDPMCGIGTSLVEAVHLQRHALGVWSANRAGPSSRWQTCGTPGRTAPRELGWF